MAILNILGLEPFFYYYVFNKTLNLSNVKYILAYITQYSPRKIYKRLYGKTILVLYKMGAKYCSSSSYLWRYIHFPTII